ncbi:hypothetical protein ACFLS0_01940 [Candidatus Bipolaricaulota bacterium]
MKLGIAVVYMVLPGEEELVDLHLRQIERCTRVPFTLYAAANRLPANLRDQLAAKPYIRMCSIPTTDLRGSLEHAYYLERLIATAIEAGVTHVVTLHVDSFPIRSAWAIDLAAKLSHNYAFASIVRDELRDPKPMTACLFFSREFYVPYQPKLLLPRAAMRSAVGREYVRHLAAPNESGTGYGFLVFKEDLQWFPLRRTNLREDHYYFGSIHDDLVFHLGSATFESRGFPGAREYLWMQRVRQKMSVLLPHAMNKFLKDLIPQRLLHPGFPAHRRAYSTVKEALIADPEGYLRYLRTGRR